MYRISFVTVNVINLERFQKYLNSSMFSSRLLLLGGISDASPAPSFSILLMFSWDVFRKCLPFPCIIEQVDSDYFKLCYYILFSKKTLSGSTF